MMGTMRINIQLGLGWKLNMRDSNRSTQYLRTIPLNGEAFTLFVLSRLKSPSHLELNDSPLHFPAYSP